MLLGALGPSSRGCLGVTCRPTRPASLPAALASWSSAMATSVPTVKAPTEAGALAAQPMTGASPPPPPVPPVVSAPGAVRYPRHAAIDRSRGVSLVVGTTTDPASINPFRCLLQRGAWQQRDHVEDLEAWCPSGGQLVRLWKLQSRMIGQDHLDERWTSATGEPVREVIFLSKHVAASGKPALTLHPIGVPALLPGEVPQVGGKPGRAAPPSPRLGAWLRLLRSLARERGLMPEFEVTYEATHHGPHLESPAMFVEIGSTEEYWGREDAAEAIAELVWQGLGLDGSPQHGDWYAPTLRTPTEDGEGGGESRARESGSEAGETLQGPLVMLGLGGGHYVPRHVDAATKNDGVWVGHLLAAYSMDIPLTDAATEEVDGEPRWKRAVREVLLATAAAFPRGRVAAMIDEKSLKPPQRTALKAFLDAEGVPCAKAADFASARPPP